MLGSVKAMKASLHRGASNEQRNSTWAPPLSCFQNKDLVPRREKKFFIQDLLDATVHSSDLWLLFKLPSWKKYNPIIRRKTCRSSNPPRMKNFPVTKPTRGNSVKGGSQGLLRVDHLWAEASLPKEAVARNNRQPLLQAAETRGTWKRQNSYLRSRRNMFKSGSLVNLSHLHQNNIHSVLAYQHYQHNTEQLSKLLSNQRLIT